MAAVLEPGRAADPPERRMRIIGYTAADLEYMTGIKKATFDTWRSEGRGPQFMRVEGRKIIYPADRFEAWWREQEAGK